jgi:hypothetical protein
MRGHDQPHLKRRADAPENRPTHKIFLPPFQPMASRIPNHGLESPCQCVHETMNSECESHYLRGDRDCGAVEGNCVAARRGGEQPETEGRSRTKVNSIRHVRRASLLARGEACRVSGKPVTALTLSKLATGRLGCGWSENDPKRAWDKWRSRRGELSRDGVRGSIVAMKPVNAGGAKGPRKVNAP